MLVDILELNFILGEYKNKTVENFKPLGPVKYFEKNNGRLKPILYEWPSEKFYFNNMFFSNIVVASKIFNLQEINYQRISLEVKFIFPQTGIARLVYLKNNQITLDNVFVNNFISKYYLILKYLYLLFICSFIILYLKLIFIKR